MTLLNKGWGMIFLRLLRYAVGLALVGVVCAALWPCGLRYVPHIVCHGECSGQLQEEIMHLCCNHMHNSPQQLFAILHTQFPILDHITLRYTADGSALLECSVHAPVVCIDEHHVVAQNGLLVDSCWYKSDQLQRCLSMVSHNVQQAAAQSQEMIYFAHLIDEYVAKHYVIEWKDKLEILLKNKNKPFTIVSRYDRLLDQELLTKVEKICADKIHRKGQNTLCALVADTRFEQQVVVRESVRRG